MCQVRTCALLSRDIQALLPQPETVYLYSQVPSELARNSVNALLFQPITANTFSCPQPEEKVMPSREESALLADRDLFHGTTASVLMALTAK
jgi:hypothetical protein